MKKEQIESIIKELHLFPHKIEGKARFEDIDLMQVVHNQKYIYWIENARIEFIQEMLFPDFNGNFLDIFPLLIVRHEVDYYGITRFNQNYAIYSRITNLGRSSVQMENIIVINDNEPVVHNLTTFVHTEKDFSKSKEISADFREKILNFSKRK